MPEPTKLLVTAELAAAPQEKLTQQPGPPGRLHPSKLRLRVLHRCPYRLRATSPGGWGSYPRDQSLQSCHPRHGVYYYKVTTLLYNIAGNNADQTKLTLATAPPITFARKLRTRSPAPAFVSTRREQAIKRLQPCLSPQNCWSPQGLRLLLKRS